MYICISWLWGVDGLQLWRQFHLYGGILARERSHSFLVLRTFIPEVLWGLAAKRQREAKQQGETVAAARAAAAAAAAGEDRDGLPRCLPRMSLCVSHSRRWWGPAAGLQGPQRLVGVSFLGIPAAATAVKDVSVWYM